MSTLNSHTTADYMEWTTMSNLIKQLYRDGKYRMGLLIGCGCFFGLKVSELRSLKWSQIINSEKFIVKVSKTGAEREIDINEGFQTYIKDCFKALEIKNDDECCFLNKYGKVITVQMINRHLKSIKGQYGLKIQNFSSHTFRKTFGRKVLENAGKQQESALVKLSEIFNHANTSITRQYLGLPEKEYKEIYNKLDF